MPGRYGDNPDGGQFQGVSIPRAGGGLGMNFHGGSNNPNSGGVDTQRHVSVNRNPNRHGTYTISVSCCDDAFSCLNVLKIFLAELLATCLLLFLGCSGMIIMPITFGVAIAAATQIFGDISGAHINPAVTLAALVMGRIGNILMVPIYIVAQFLGALAGYGLHFALVSANSSDLRVLCVLRPPSIVWTENSGSAARKGLDLEENLFGMELLMSVIYIMAICAMWDHADRFGGDHTIPLKRGFFYTGIVLCFYYVLSAPLGLNPVRAIAPLIFNSYKTQLDGVLYGHWEVHWVYWLGPLLGSLFGALIYRGMTALHQKTSKHLY